MRISGSSGDGMFPSNAVSSHDRSFTIHADKWMRCLLRVHTTGTREGSTNIPRIRMFHCQVRNAEFILGASLGKTVEPKTDDNL